MSDYPFDEIAEAVEEHLARGYHIHQKWSCGSCGSRQTMAQADTLFRAGKCEECNATTIIRACNYMLIMGRP